MVQSGTCRRLMCVSFGFFWVQILVSPIPLSSQTALMDSYGFHLHELQFIMGLTVQDFRREKKELPDERRLQLKGSLIGREITPNQRIWVAEKIEKKGKKEISTT